MLLRSIFDVLFPRYCPVCGRRLLNDESAICLQCNINLPRTQYSLSPYDNKLARQFWGRLPIEKACCLYYHRPKTPIAKIIYSFKYYNNPRLARQMGIIIAEDIIAFPPQSTPNATFFDDIDVIIPVPLSSKKKRKRGYNQSMEICKGIQRVTHISIIEKAIRRKTDKQSQTKLMHHERMDNIQGVYELNAKYINKLTGKHVLLVDDVITTGSTTISCGKTLVGIDGIKISILSLAFTSGI